MRQCLRVHVIKLKQNFKMARKYHANTMRFSLFFFRVLSHIQSPLIVLTVAMREPVTKVV